MKSKPQQPPVENDPPMQGEGNYAAGRRYDEAQREFVQSGQVDDAARKSAPKDAQEAQELNQAEKAGRQKAKR
jgi:hypothetical protein